MLLLILLLLFSVKPTVSIIQFEGGERKKSIPWQGDIYSIERGLLKQCYLYENMKKFGKPMKISVTNVSLTLIFEPCHDKTNIMGLRPAWIQTSLRICAV
jgi:hypothetical protein